MGSEWTESTLAELSSSVSYGYTESASPDKVGPHFLRITDIQNGVVDWNSVPYCPISEKDHLKYKLNEGDIVVARTGNSTGENYLFEGNHDAVFASYLIRFCINDSLAHPKFVWYSMRSQDWWAFVNGSKTGSAQAGANAKVLGRFHLDLPPLPEQKAIAHILGTLDDKIELNRRMNATLEGMAQALFKSWFVDFDPVIDNALAAGNPIPDELAPRAEVRRQALSDQKTGTTQQGSIDDSTLSDPKSHFPAAFQFTEELGWIPEGWDVGCIADLCNTVTDGSHHSPKSVDKASGQPMASSKDLTQLGIDFESCRFISKNNFSELERNGCSPQIGDVLIAKDGARCGETCCIHVDDDPVVLLSSVAILRPKTASLSTFLSTLMSRAETVADLRENYVSGSAIPRIILRDFKRFPVLTFPSSILETWVKHSQAIHRRAVASRDEAKKLSRLRDTLLPRLISGELSTDALSKTNE
ncbi:MAG: restriction endonuclease subunit S [Verrucomicrobiales bacterium]